jgi:hypothetical protein
MTVVVRQQDNVSIRDGYLLLGSGWRCGRHSGMITGQAGRDAAMSPKEFALTVEEHDHERPGAEQGTTKDIPQGAIG